MKILHIFDHSIPLHSGYTFRSQAILQHQHDFGWDTCHLTSIKHNHAVKRELDDEENVDGLHFYRTRSSNRLFSKFPLLDQLDVVKTLNDRLDEVIQKEKPDILHAHSPCLNGLAAVKAGNRHNIPVVYECRAFWEDAAVDHGTSKEWGLRYRVTRSLETKVFKNADAVTTICNGLRQDILDRGINASKVTVIPNAVDISKFNTNPQVDHYLQKSLNLEGNRILGFIGSFYAYEGLGLLIEALSEIQSNIPDVKLLLVGGGPQEKFIKQLVESHDLEDRVTFTGRVPHTDVQKYYDLVDIFVYPRLPMRLTELVTPLKPLEALAQKRLVVASDVGGHKELLQDGVTGMLFKANDVNSLATTVVNLLKKEEDWEKIRVAGRAFVENERNWKVSVSNYKAVYENLLVEK